MESGRSLVEMLGVLAIMGILSIGGMAMYSSAMTKHRANTLIEEAQKRATVASAQIIMQGKQPNLAEFDSFNATEVGRFGDVTQEGLSHQFGIKINYVEKAVCRALLNIVGDQTSIRRLSYPTTPTTPISGCDEVGNYLIIYNDDLSPKDQTESVSDPIPEENQPQECEEDTDCQTVCGTCQIDAGLTKGVCVGECEAPADYCDDNTDCNTENDCMICDTSSHSCKDGCKRVEYLESTGTQYIDTGIPLSNENTVKAKIRIIYETNSFFYGARKRYMVDAFGLHKTYAPFGSDSGINYVNLYAGTDYIVEQSQNGIFINGELKKTYPVSTFTTQENCYLFYIRQESGFYDSPASARIYYFQVWDNGTLIRDFIPVLDWDMRPSMYDKVSGKLFYNQGTGAFKTNLD